MIHFAEPEDEETLCGVRTDLVEGLYRIETSNDPFFVTCTECRKYPCPVNWKHRMYPDGTEIHGPWTKQDEYQHLSDPDFIKFFESINKLKPEDFKKS